MSSVPFFFLWCLLDFLPASPRHDGELAVRAVQDLRAVVEGLDPGLVLVRQVAISGVVRAHEMHAEHHAQADQQQRGGASRHVRACRRPNPFLYRRRGRGVAGEQRGVLAAVGESAMASGRDRCIDTRVLTPRDSSLRARRRVSDVSRALRGGYIIFIDIPRPALNPPRHSDNKIGLKISHFDLSSNLFGFIRCLRLTREDPDRFCVDAVFQKSHFKTYASSLLLG